MTQWEYTHHFYNHSNFRNRTVDDMMEDDDNWYKRLNEFGEQGWESYAVIKDGNTTNFYFKRPKNKTQ